MLGLLAQAIGHFTSPKTRVRVPDPENANKDILLELPRGFSQEDIDNMPPQNRMKLLKLFQMKPDWNEKEVGLLKDLLGWPDPSIISGRGPNGYLERV